MNRMSYPAAARPVSGMFGDAASKGFGDLSGIGIPAPMSTASMMVTAASVIVNGGAGMGGTYPVGKVDSLPLGTPGSATSGPLSNFPSIRGSTMPMDGSKFAGGNLLNSAGRLDPGAAFSYMRGKGLNDVQAATVLGTFTEESTLNPAAFNRKEGAIGLFQARADRADNIFSMARTRGVSATDPQVQIDALLGELKGSEAARGGTAFLNSTDLVGANRAMKGVIRYGSDTFNDRLQHSQDYLGKFGGRTGPADQASESLTALSTKATEATKGLGSFGSGLDQFGSKLASAGGGSGGGGFGGFGSLFGGGGGSGFDIDAGETWSANGNIMTSRGPLPLSRYANGGIANSPQVSIFGEGRNPEAYVPLPDGRSIPVSMKMPTMPAPANNNAARAPSQIFVQHSPTTTIMPAGGVSMSELKAHLDARDADNNRTLLDRIDGARRAYG